MSPAELDREARVFSDRLERLLNGTVTEGIPISAVLARDRGLGYVGYGISTRDPIPTSLVPMTIGRAQPSCFLELAHYLRLDDEGEHLMDVRASFGLHLTAEMDAMIVRYDYVRDQADHAAAHVHVGGNSPALEELCDRREVKRPAIDRRHFPVGGKRFRPCLEDLIEFAIHEGLADGKPGWQEVVNEHRGEFHQLQLRAAVRREPQAAADQLRAMDWSCTEPR